MKRNKVFVNAPLSTLAEQRFNEALARVLSEEGFEYYLPQDAVAPDSSASPQQVLEANLKSIERCDIVLSVLDKPGFGVAFELGFALASNKPIIALRTDTQDYLGKVGEGFWKDARYLPSHFKVRSLDELRELLRRLKDQGGLS